MKKEGEFLLLKQRRRENEGRRREAWCDIGSGLGHLENGSADER